MNANEVFAILNGKIKAGPYGSPLVATTVAGMTDHDRVYVYTGDEDGYTAGNWYYWNGTAWTSGGVYNATAVVTDPTLTESGVAADAEATGAAIDELREDLTQIAEDVDTVKDNPVALAEQLDSKIRMIDQTPYMFRPTPTGAGNRLWLDKIVGASVAWNQLVDDTNYTASGDIGITKTGHKFELSPNASATGIGFVLPTDTKVLGHKYLISLKASLDYESSAYIRIRLGDATGNYVDLYPTASLSQYSVFYAPTNVSGTRLAFILGNVDDAVLENVQLFDLTAMFGSTIADYIYSLEQATAGAGVAWFRKLFPNDYYAYNAGELKSVEGVSAHKTVGFNQWDEEWEVGSIASATGANIGNANTLRSKNYIPIVDGQTYYFRMGSTNNAYVFCYDADKNYLGLAHKPNEIITTLITNREFVLLDGTSFIKFYAANYILNYGTYQNDICINLSDSARNGQYEPYEEHSYPLDSDVTLRGIYKLDANNSLYADGDEYTPDGVVTRRYGIVDLGTLDWNKSASTSSSLAYFVTRSALNNAMGNSESSFNGFCTKGYAPRGTNSISSYDKSIGIGGTSGKVFITDSDYNEYDYTQFKTAMSGVYLVYELATPTTEDGTPYQHMQVCDPDGTEEFVSTGIAPVGHYSAYPENQVAKLDGLPKDFSTLIAPTEKTNVATRNYTTGSLLIIDNVLYKVTANIANGGTITVGTNVTATTLAEVIAALS